MIRRVTTINIHRFCFAILFLVSLLGSLDTFGEDKIDPKQNEALLSAVEAGDLALATTLLHKGANPNTTREEGSTLTVLMLAARNGHSGLVKALLDAGADPNTTAAVAVGVSQINEGITALMLSAASGDAKTMQLLLDHGAYAKLKDSTGNTLLHYAVEELGATEVVCLALAQGVDRKAKNVQGQTALDKAKAAGNASAVVELMR